MSTEFSSEERRQQEMDRQLAIAAHDRERQWVLQDALKKTDAAKSAGPAVAPTPAADTPVVPIMATSLVRGHMLVVLVGAGGTGARILPPMMQMLRTGDSVAVIDHDIVEDRNLRRQHFAARDIGAPKASVLATRYRREGIGLNAFQTKLTDNDHRSTFNSIYAAANMPQRPSSMVVIGGVDNAAARRSIRMSLKNGESLGIPNVAWIDVGNETRGGQAILTLDPWQLKLSGRVPHGGAAWRMRGMEAMPQLLVDAEVDTASCGERVDLQTVQVNHMAACAAINCLSWLMLGIPFISAGSFFSTLNTMQPIKLDRVDTSRGSIHPETTFAQGQP